VRTSTDAEDGRVADLSLRRQASLRTVPRLKRRSHVVRARFKAAAAVVLTLCASARAADPASLYGKWIEKFANGNGMVTEFTPATLSYYPVDAAGRATEAARQNEVTYVDLDKETVRINLQGGGAVSVRLKDAQNIVLDYGGAGIHRLVRLAP
jgi:hypothetical protein